MASLADQISSRRTFAIISHPDAGKTTLTEKLLLYTGTIQSAGSVKGKQNARHAVSDWMDIEKQRGISVTSSVLQFTYGGCCVNILDTPGHQDFSEDTYRTLMAADAAVMVIDGAKGVEAQTKKLFRVCALRGIPIFTFVNKMDRETRDPFDLMEEVENVLGIRTYPMNWPIGNGRTFRGVFDRASRHVLAFEGDGRANGTKKVDEIEATLGDEALNELIGEDNHKNLMDDIELLDGADSEFDLDAVLSGKLSPVFFGSALTNFGVEPFLKDFLRLAPGPSTHVDALTGDVIEPTREEFSGFVFKIQANMDKNHRDRIAFVRICSGKFERGMEAFHMQGGRKLKLATGTTMMADDRAIVDEAYAGDIVGLFDPGIFSIGDTLCTGKKHVQFAGIPTFAPEHFARISQVDTLKRKQFVKGMEQLAMEGAVQIFRELGAGMESVIVGVVAQRVPRRGAPPGPAVQRYPLDSERARQHRHRGPVAHARHAARRGHARRQAAAVHESVEHRLGEGPQQRPGPVRVRQRGVLKSGGVRAGCLRPAAYGRRSTSAGRVRLRLHEDGGEHGNEHGGQHIGDAEGLSPDEVDAHAEDEDRSHGREVRERRRGHDRLQHARQHRQRALEHHDGDHGEDASLAHRSRHRAYQQRIDGSFQREGRVVSRDAVLDRSDDGHGADGDRERRGHEGVDERGVAVAARRVFEPLAESVDLPFEVEHLADQRAEGERSYDQRGVAGGEASVG